MSTGLTHWEKREQRTTPLKEQQTSPPIESPLLTIHEAVAYLRLSQSTVYTRMAEFDVVRLGGRVYLTRAGCDRYIATNTRKATIPPKRRRRKISRALDDAAARSKALADIT